MLDTTNWAVYPFSVDGVEFLSKFNKEGGLFAQVKNLPIGVLNTMNEECIREIIGKVSNLSRSELLDELSRINQGATQAVLELA